MSVTRAGLLADTYGSSGSSGTIPVGGIILWSGTIASIPTGWALCNGSNGTPDLRDRFVVGASVDVSGQSRTSITGSNTKSGGSKDSIVVSHSHTGTTASDGAHRHFIAGNGSIGQMGNYQNNISARWAISGFVGNDPRQDYVGAATNTEATYGGTSEAGSHTHTFTTSTEGSSGTNANLPPYFALAFIMRIG